MFCKSHRGSLHQEALHLKRNPPAQRSTCSTPNTHTTHLQGQGHNKVRTWRTWKTWEYACLILRTAYFRLITTSHPIAASPPSIFPFFCRLLLFSEKASCFHCWICSLSHEGRSMHPCYGQAMHQPCMFPRKFFPRRLPSVPWCVSFPVSSLQAGPTALAAVLRRGPIQDLPVC